MTPLFLYFPLLVVFFTLLLLSSLYEDIIPREWEYRTVRFFLSFSLFLFFCGLFFFFSFSFFLLFCFFFFFFFFFFFLEKSPPKESESWISRHEFSVEKNIPPGKFFLFLYVPLPRAFVLSPLPNIVNPERRWPRFFLQYRGLSSSSRVIFPFLLFDFFLDLFSSAVGTKLTPPCSPKARPTPDTFPLYTVRISMA